MIDLNELTIQGVTHLKGHPFEIRDDTSDSVDRLLRLADIILCVRRQVIKLEEEIRKEKKIQRRIDEMKTEREEGKKSKARRGSSKISSLFVSLSLSIPPSHLS